MELGKAYRINKASTDGTFDIGDIVWKSPNGDINSATEHGWITPKEVGSDTYDFECEVASDYVVIIDESREICIKNSNN